MDRPDVLQLTLTEHGIDAGHAGLLMCPTGVVLVEMLPPPLELKGLLLPDRVRADCRPDVGAVLSCGPDVSLELGQLVAVRAYDGQWIDGFAIEEQGAGTKEQAAGSKAGSLLLDPSSSGRVYATRNQVRIYGHYSPHQGTCERCRWFDSIPVVILPEEDAIVATHCNLIVRREAPVRRERGIELPDSEVYRTGLATIESIGPKAELETRAGPAQVGDRIHYDTRGELEFAFGGDPDLAVIPDAAVNFVIRPDRVP